MSSGSARDIAETISARVQERVRRSFTTSSLHMLVSRPFCLTYSSWVPMIPATLDESVSFG